MKQAIHRIAARLEELDAEIRSKCKDRFAKVTNLATYRVWNPVLSGGDSTLILDDKVKAAGEAVEAKRTEAQAAWKKFDDLRAELAKSDTDLSDDESEGFQKAEEAHREYASLADELSALENRREKLWAMSAEKNGPAETKGIREEIKDGLASRESIGARIVASDAYQELKASGMLTSRSKLGNIALGEMMTRDELRSALIVSDSDGDNSVAPFIDPQHRGFVEPRFRPLLITDLITVLETDSDSVDYVVETGWENNAGFVAEAVTDAAVGGGVDSVEAGVKPQSALTYERRDAVVKTVAHWIAATRKSLADAARLRSIIETRLRRGLADVVEDQVIEGDGTGENLLGVLNTSGIQHQDRVGSLVDDILRAATKLRLAFFDPTAVALNPLDWEGIRLSRDESGGSSDTGGYLFGPPSQAGASTLWGMPVASGPQFPQDNPVVADWRVVELYIREGVQVMASDSHADFFTRNLVAILAEMRLALAIPQPEGICEVSEQS